MLEMKILNVLEIKLLKYTSEFIDRDCDYITALKQQNYFVCNIFSINYTIYIISIIYA
jgi:hypothetical protein